MLNRPMREGKFSVHTDASDTGIGAVLYQSVEEEERVIEFASRTLTSAEKNYSVTEKECLAVVFGIRKFRQYIEGEPFTVVTDHSSLKWLTSLKNPTSRLARWALELQGHYFTVEYRKGALNHVPDVLSRMFEKDETAICAISWASTTTDEWYRAQAQKVMARPEKFPRWKIVGGNLYYYRPDVIIDESLVDADAWKLVIPQEHRQEVLQECHDRPEAGHFGREKTAKTLATYYFWPQFYRDVEEYVKRCQVCQQIKVDQRKQYGLMGSRVMEKPWHTVAGDIMGPLPKSPSRAEYLLVFQDLFTRWVEAIPVAKANAQTIVKKFKDHVVLRFTTPEVFLSDNGTEFKNKLVDDYLAEIGTRHMTTPPCHAQANPVERANRTLKQMLAAFVQGAHNHWDKHLPELVSNLNRAVSSTTGLSPAMLNYGRQPVPPGILRRHKDLDAQEQIEQDAVNEWNDRLQNLSQLHDLTAERSKAEQSSQAKYYDAGRREDTFQVGELVWKRNRVLSSSAQGVTAKLAPKYAGPLMIRAIKGSNTYELLHSDGFVEDLVHAKDLKKYFGQETEVQSQEIQEAQDLAEDIQQESRPSRRVQATSNPPDASVAAPREEQGVEPVSGAVANRKRGRPRKTVYVVKRPQSTKATMSQSKGNPTKRKPGRPPGKAKPRNNPE